MGKQYKNKTVRTNNNVAEQYDKQLSIYASGGQRDGPISRSEWEQDDGDWLTYEDYVQFYFEDEYGEDSSEMFDRWAQTAQDIIERGIVEYHAERNDLSKDSKELIQQDIRRQYLEEHKKYVANRSLKQKKKRQEDSRILERRIEVFMTNAMKHISFTFKPPTKLTISDYEIAFSAIRTGNNWFKDFKSLPKNEFRIKRKVSLSIYNFACFIMRHINPKDVAVVQPISLFQSIREQNLKGRNDRVKSQLNGNNGEVTGDDDLAMKGTIDDALHQLEKVNMKKDPVEIRELHRKLKEAKQHQHHKKKVNFKANPVQLSTPLSSINAMLLKQNLGTKIATVKEDVVQPLAQKVVLNLPPKINQAVCVKFHPPELKDEVELPGIPFLVKEVEGLKEGINPNVLPCPFTQPKDGDFGERGPFIEYTNNWIKIKRKWVDHSNIEDKIAYIDESGNGCKRLPEKPLHIPPVCTAFRPNMANVFAELTAGRGVHSLGHDGPSNRWKKIVEKNKATRTGDIKKVHKTKIVPVFIARTNFVRACRIAFLCCLTLISVFHVERYLHLVEVTWIVCMYCTWLFIKWYLFWYLLILGICLILTTDTCTNFVLSVVKWVRYYNLPFSPQIMNWVSGLDRKDVILAVITPISRFASVPGFYEVAEFLGIGTFREEINIIRELNVTHYHLVAVDVEFLETMIANSDGLKPVPELRNILARNYGPRFSDRSTYKNTIIYFIQEAEKTEVYTKLHQLSYKSSMPSR